MIEKKNEDNCDQELRVGEFGPECADSRTEGSSESEKIRRLPKESEGLEPMVGPGVTIGYVSDINGPDAELVPFDPTRAELMTLGFHYLKRAFSVEESFAMGCGGSWEIREHPFAWERFDTIAKALNPTGEIKEFQEYIKKRGAEVDALREESESYTGKQCSADQVEGQSVEDIVKACSEAARRRYESSKGSEGLGKGFVVGEQALDELPVEEDDFFKQLEEFAQLSDDELEQLFPTE